MEDKREHFTYGHYQQFIERLSRDYWFATFGEAKRVSETIKPLVIMRHDVDMDLEAAHKMALLEKELGISSTFFFLLRNPLYNVFSSEGSKQVKQILANGHHFGLHFDCSLYPDVSMNDLEYYISKECSMLEEFFENPIDAISFHRPGHMELNGVELGKWPNSYERIFLEVFEYFSDSRGKWARGNPLESEAFLNRRNLHILVHPIWWTETPVTPYQRLISLVEQISHRSEQYISDNCQVWDEGKKGRQTGPQS